MSINTNDIGIVFSQFEQLASMTYARSVITYVNDDFTPVAGYSCDELVGRRRNIVRYPDMTAIKNDIAAIKMKFFSYIHTIVTG